MQKLEKVKIKIPDIIRLVTNSSFSIKFGGVENKMADVVGLVTKTSFNAKIGEIKKKFLIMLNILPLLNLITLLVKYSMQS